MKLHPLLIGLLTLLPTLTRAESPARPNFLVLFADDLTFRALGYTGETEVKTPNIDRLAQRGTVFTHAFIQGGTSGAVCVASRATLMTGRSLWSCGGRDGDCTRDGKTFYPLWGKVLGDEGYRTFAVGKWHNGKKALENAFQTTTPTFLGGMLESTKQGGEAYHRPVPGNLWTPDDPKWQGHWMVVDGNTVHSSARWADAAIAALRTMYPAIPPVPPQATPKERLRATVKAASEALSLGPFFLYVAFDTPHDPRQAPRQYLDMYPSESLKVPPNFLPRHPFEIDSFEGRDEILAPYPRTEAIVRTHLQEYYAIISHLDAQIGRILDELERSGQAKNTVIIFMGDNGLAVGQHGLIGKQSLYDHSIRVPLILAGPGIPVGKRCDALVYLTSLFATTCELAEIPVPPTVQFPSLVPLLDGRKVKLYDDIYGGFVDRQRMVRTERWKLILTPDAGMVQLFDIANDPWEQHNLARDPARAGLIADLYERLKTWMKIEDDPMPVARLDATLAAFRQAR